MLRVTNIHHPIDVYLLIMIHELLIYVNEYTFYILIVLWHNKLLEVTDNKDPRARVE